jgi:hypothetical protein
MPTVDLVAALDNQLLPVLQVIGREAEAWRQRHGGRGMEAEAWRQRHGGTEAWRQRHGGRGMEAEA